MDRRQAWNIARDRLCEGCPQARGCQKPCQALYMEVVKVNPTGLIEEKV